MQSYMEDTYMGILNLLIQHIKDTDPKFDKNLKEYLDGQLKTCIGIERVEPQLPSRYGVIKAVATSLGVDVSPFKPNYP